MIDAMNAVEAMPDPGQRAKAISEVLAHQTDRAKEWRKMRRAFVLDLRAQKPPVSYRKIAAMLGISLGTVQDIERGYSGSGKNRPRKGDVAPPAAGSAAAALPPVRLPQDEQDQA